MSIFLCFIYKLNGWFSVMDHPIKSILSISKQLRVVIAPGPFFPLHFSLREASSVTFLPVPSTVSRGLKQGKQHPRDTVHFDSNFLTYVPLLQAESHQINSPQMTVSEVWDRMSAAGVGAEATELSIRHKRPWFCFQLSWKLKQAIYPSASMWSHRIYFDISFAKVLG